MRFASFLSGGFITDIVVNPPERKLAKRTFVHCALKQQQQKIWSWSNADLKLYCSITLRISGLMLQVHLISGPTNSISIDSAVTVLSCTEKLFEI